MSQRLMSQKISATTSLLRFSSHYLLNFCRDFPLGVQVTRSNDSSFQFPISVNTSLETKILIHDYNDTKAELRELQYGRRSTPDFRILHEKRFSDFLNIAQK